MVVHEAVGREDVVQVASRGGLLVAAEPALRPGVLTVVAVAFHIVAAALVLAEGVGVGRGAVGDVGIHVPHHAVAFVVGAPEGVPNLLVGDDGVVLDDVVQCRPQFLSGLAGGVVVIVGGCLGQCDEACECEKQE